MDGNRKHDRAIIAALVSCRAADTDERIQALTAVLAQRGIEIVGCIIQRRGVSRFRSEGGARRLSSPMSPATFLGTGKAKELALLAKERAATAVYFLNDLSMGQIQRLCMLTDCEVISVRENSQHFIKKDIV